MKRNTRRQAPEINSPPNYDFSATRKSQVTRPFNLVPTANSRRTPFGSFTPGPQRTRAWREQVARKQKPQTMRLVDISIIVLFFFSLSVSGCVFKSCKKSRPPFAVSRKTTRDAPAPGLPPFPGNPDSVAYVTANAAFSTAKKSNPDICSNEKTCVYPLPPREFHRVLFGRHIPTVFHSRTPRAIDTRPVASRVGAGRPGGQASERASESARAQYVERAMRVPEPAVGGRRRRERGRTVGGGLGGNRRRVGGGPRTGGRGAWSIPSRVHSSPRRRRRRRAASRASPTHPHTRARARTPGGRRRRRRFRRHRSVFARRFCVHPRRRPRSPDVRPTVTRRRGLCARQSPCRRRFTVYRLLRLPFVVVIRSIAVAPHSIAIIAFSERARARASVPRVHGNRNGRRAKCTRSRRRRCGENVSRRHFRSRVLTVRTRAHTSSSSSDDR